jgi:hypothetical protein
MRIQHAHTRHTILYNTTFQTQGFIYVNYLLVGTAADELNGVEDDIVPHHIPALCTHRSNHPFSPHSTDDKIDKNSLTL